MILLIDTTKERIGRVSLDKLEESPKCKSNYEYSFCEKTDASCTKI